MNATEPLAGQDAAEDDQGSTTAWELECTCPDFCERDHERD
ncbi:MAG: hypothetical protein ACRDM1_02335 [Gaiellaceae bacterium]